MLSRVRLHKLALDGSVCEEGEQNPLRRRLLVPLGPGPVPTSDLCLPLRGRGRTGCLDRRCEEETTAKQQQKQHKQTCGDTSSLLGAPSLPSWRAKQRATAARTTCAAAATSASTSPCTGATSCCAAPRSAARPAWSTTRARRSSAARRPCPSASWRSRRASTSTSARTPRTST